MLPFSCLRQIFIEWFLDDKILGWLFCCKHLVHKVQQQCVMLTSVISTTHPGVTVVPKLFTFRMTSYQANIVLYDGHGVTIHVGGHDLKLGLVAYQSTAIVKEHSVWFYHTITILPHHGQIFGMWSMCICARAADVLHSIYIL